VAARRRNPDRLVNNFFIGLVLLAVAASLSGCGSLISQPTPQVVDTRVVDPSSFPATATAEPTPTQLPSPTPIPTHTATITPTTPPEVEAPISCSEAGSAVDQTITCRIEQAYCSYHPEIQGSPTFCNNAAYPGHSFTLLVWGEDWSQFDGQCLDVTGVVTVYDRKPQIETKTLSQVRVCK
jgi:hypothetical protein